MPFTLNTESIDWADADLKIRFRDPDTNKVRVLTPAQIGADATLQTHLTKKSLAIDSEAPSTSPVSRAVRTAYAAGSGAGKVSNTADDDYNPGGGVGVGTIKYVAQVRHSLLIIPAS